MPTKKSLKNKQNNVSKDNDYQRNNNSSENFQSQFESDDSKNNVHKSLDSSNHFDQYDIETNDDQDDIEYSEPNGLNGIEPNEHIDKKVSFIKRFFGLKHNKEKEVEKEYSNIPKAMLNNDLMQTLEANKEEEKENKKQAKQLKKENAESHRNDITGRKRSTISRLAKNTKFKKNIIDLLGYKALTEDKYNYLVTADEDNKTSGLAEILKIGGVGIGGLSDNMKQSVAVGFIKFLRMYPEDIEFIALPIPNDTKRQQKKWELLHHKIQEELANNSYSDRERKQKIERLKYIKEAILQFKDVEINLINQGFFLVIYQDLTKSTPDVETGEIRSVFRQTTLALSKKVNKALGIDHDYRSINISRADSKEKEKLIKRINNPRNII